MISIIIGMLCFVMGLIVGWNLMRGEIINGKVLIGDIIYICKEFKEGKDSE